MTLITRHLYYGNTNANIYMYTYKNRFIVPGAGDRENGFDAVANSEIQGCGKPLRQRH